MKRDYSIIGEVFGDLKCIGFAETVKRSPKSGARTMWKCVCLLCGNQCVVERNNLVSGNTSSCGCQWGLREKVSWLVGCDKSTVSTVLAGGKSKGGQGSIHWSLAERIREGARLIGVKGRRYRDQKKWEIEPDKIPIEGSLVKESV